MRATHAKRPSRRLSRASGTHGIRTTRSEVAKASEVAPAFVEDQRVPDRLLACTTEILSEQGVASVSLRAVARRAGVSHGAPAYHFRSKAGLLTAYATAGFRELGKRLASTLEHTQKDPRARLAAIGQAYVRFAVRNPQQFEIMFRREMHGAGSKSLEDASLKCSNVLADVIGEAVRDGLIPPDQAKHAVGAAWSIAHGLAVLVLEERLPARLNLHPAGPGPFRKETRDPLLFAQSTLDFFVAAILRPGGGWGR